MRDFANPSDRISPRGLVSTLSKAALGLAMVASAWAHAQDTAFASQPSTARFLTQATFGPTSNDLASLVGQSASAWYRNQLVLPASSALEVVKSFEGVALNNEEDFNVLEENGPTTAFWRHALTGEDQLKQRVAFALSELLVVSNASGAFLADVPHAMAAYQDILRKGSLGNYRDLLQAVTYSPAMGYYLTYLGSQKGDPETGRMPDENYARELLQLFTLGLIELNPDGTAKLDEQGNEIELFDNQDITGLARVFTGFQLDPDYIDRNSEDPFDSEDIALAASSPMWINPRRHSEREKAFLGTVIAANTPGDTSVDMALDHIFEHPNVGPFIGRQLIQRLVTSNPTPAYVGRVTSAFDAGHFTLPDGQQVGEGRRGDLAATIAAILFDSEARELSTTRGGKVREPLLRFSAWARAFNMQSIYPEYTPELWDTSSSEDLGQHPYRSPSVFNFFRPGYVPPATYAAYVGLVLPEMQLVNASSISGYANFMTWFVSGERGDVDVEEIREQFEGFFGEDIAEETITAFRTSLVPSFTYQRSLAADTGALIEHLNQRLTYGTLSWKTRQDITAAVEIIPESNADARVKIAMLMLVTSPDFIVQR